MFNRVLLAVLFLLASPAAASGGETWPVAAHALFGHAYLGDNIPSQIRFISVRRSPVVINWVAFDGTEYTYAKLGEGGRLFNPH